MRVRGLLIAIVVAALVVLASLSQLREVKRAGFEWTPGILTVIVLAMAVTGHRFAWALAFVVAAIGTGFQAVYALSDLGEPSRLAVAGIGAVVILALWGLKPDEEPTPASRDQG